MRRVSRREVLGAGIGGCLAAPWLLSHGMVPKTGGVTDTQIVLGVSAAFSGPSRGLGIELYRGAMACFNHVNSAGGVNGRKIVLKTYDDGYQPTPCVENTVKLTLDDQVFALFGYVGTPAHCRILPGRCLRPQWLGGCAARPRQIR